MYLKQIEIHGFKSFANETVLTFEKGITGIVGPNGSGKSNIADAVRWVLGERSMKQLRGAETLDVIFSGTELRKAQAFAYVNLIIDNSDKKIPISYDEIQVSRRLYRNGESEYKLNNTDCRLKDIVELFYDTGIGKEGYSIIGQGQIDKILSNKPEDRRELFDEAVGIVKYKRRKSIAEKKLEEEKLNLSRVSDIIVEIERQIGPLKKQAEAAKEYLNMKDDLMLYESNYFVRVVDDESKKIEELNKKIDINKQNVKEINAEKYSFNEKYNQIEKEITSIDIAISDLKDQNNDKTTLIENLKGQINLFKEQISYEKSSNQGRLDRIESINKSIENTIAQIESNISKLSVLKNQIDFIRTSSTEIDVNEDSFNNDLRIINECISNTKNVTKEVFGDNYNVLSNVSESNIFSNDNDSTSLNAKKIDLENVEKKISNQLELINKLNDKLANANNELENINAELNNTTNRFHSEETKLETLKSMLEKFEGYLNTVKSVLDNRKNFPGIKGVVADLIETDKKYEIAIEIAIGNAIQNIVTDNVETSKKIINYLKENKLGRVTTLPLTALNIKDSEIYESVKKEDGVVDIAVNLVKYSKEYKILADYLLSRCLIVDTYDNAKEIFKKYNSGLKLVTLQGELFNPGGAISGGAFKNSSTLIGRKREYDELSKSIVVLKDKLDKLSLDKNRCSEDYDNVYNDIEKNKEVLNNLYLEKNTVNLNIISDLKLQYSNISNKIEYLSTDINNLSSTLKNYNDEKNRFKSEDTGFSNVIKYKEDKINELTEQINSINKEIDAIKSELNNKSEEKKNKLANRQEYYETKDLINDRQMQLEKESNILALDLEKANHAIEDITNSMTELYNLTYVEAKEKYKEDLGDLNSIKSSVKEKRFVLKELGPINVGAIEEYEKVGDRYDLMTTQYDDIKKSEEMISDIVKELDDSMRKQFDENFVKIQNEFQIVFKELFGGGTAKLELVEVDDKGVLDAGVSIVVQPPGKKLGNMMQLSGGEKALTAIALLFAIQNLKPSPFCLLDEIEAALDESNVDRFADYLKKLTNETQFILITHRRGTMEKTDRLYGITMQEKGITALVSVDLIEDQLDN